MSLEGMSPGRMPPGRLMAQREYARLLEPLLAQAGRYSRSMLRTRADAEDAVQQAALRGLERIHTYDAARPFKGWWFAILHNCCIDTLRRLKSARTDSLEGYDPPDTSPRDDSDSQELSLAMQHLSSEHEQILRLRYFADLNYRELAAFLRIPPGTVMSRLHLARKALQAQMRTEKV